MSVMEETYVFAAPCHAELGSVEPAVAVCDHYDAWRVRERGDVVLHTVRGYETTGIRFGDLARSTLEQGFVRRSARKMPCQYCFWVEYPCGGTNAVVFAEKTKSELEVALAVPPRRRAVVVHVDGVGKKNVAYCHVEFLGRSLPIRLKRDSLENLDIVVGDTFEWILRRDGIVRAEDVVKHPSRYTSEEVEEVRRVFENARKRWKPSTGKQ